jgi:hypothetical protein
LYYGYKYNFQFIFYKKSLDYWWILVNQLNCLSPASAIKKPPNAG